MACFRSVLDGVLTCEIERARWIAVQHGERQAFDSLAKFLMPTGHREWTSGELREQAARELVRWYPAVRAEILGAMSANRYVLAARRLHFIAVAFPSDVAQPLPDDGVIERAFQFHRAQAQRVAGTYPAAALFHRCALGGDSCPSKHAPDRFDVAALADTADLSFSMEAKPGCESIAAQAIYPEARSTGAVRTAKVAVQLTQCGALLDRVTNTQILCTPHASTAPGQTPQQQRWVEVSKRVRRYHVAGLVSVDGKPRPIETTGEAESFENVPPECAVPTSWPVITNAQDHASRSITAVVGRVLGEARSVEPAELARAAEMAVASGDLDRADHFYELACIAGGASPSDRGPREAAQRWFARRYGLPAPEDDRTGDFAPSPIGLAALHTFVRDCASH